MAVGLALVVATLAAASAAASARVVMGCNAFPSFRLAHMKAHPRDCGNAALGGSTAGIQDAHWRHWGAPVAAGRGHLVDGLGFRYPARFWVYGRSHRDGVTFYSRMHVISQGEVMGGAWRPGINKVVRVTPARLARAAAVEASHARTLACRHLSGFHGGPINDKDVPHSVAVHGMRCAVAAKAIAHSRLVGGRAGLKTPGYRCRAVKRWHVGRVTTGQRIRCTAGSHWFRFQWAT